ncbi:MAG: histidinol-phosphatase [Treponema sp.]|nr:histidinol-phosphatase [Treponema sp.]
MKTLVKTNFHTHCTFCDGKNTAEEMVQSAIERNFDILGFSSHSMYPFASSWHVSVGRHGEYCTTIRDLAQKYKDVISVLCGFEADYIEGLCAPDKSAYKEFAPDFLIGSVHYVTAKTGFFEADNTLLSVRKGIETHFGGDVRKAVQRYFQLEREMLKNCSFDILRHPDLIRKQNTGTDNLFSEDEDWYRQEVLETVEAIADAHVCVEINTGGMARGYMRTPFPSPFFLEQLHKHNVPVTINSDSHAKNTIDYWFEDAKEYARNAGYTELAYFTKDGMKMQSI